MPKLDDFDFAMTGEDTAIFMRLTFRQERNYQTADIRDAKIMSDLAKSTAACGIRFASYMASRGVDAFDASLLKVCLER